MECAMEIRGLCKRYEGFRMENVDLKFPEGSIVGLIGENGAGKSTMIKAAMNLIERDEGEVRFWGRALAENEKQFKEDIGVVFDSINFYDTLTPVRIGKICKAAYRNWREDVYSGYLKRFELPGNKEIQTFSKGMQVKLCLTVAMSHGAKLLLLDEPTSGLDPVVRDDIMDLFLEFVQEENHSVLFSSHITTDLERVADYILFLHRGRVILSESKDELIYRYGILRCGEEDYRRLDREDVLAERKSGYQWNVLVSDRERARAKYRGAVVDAATLDEIMLLYIKGRDAERTADPTGIG